MRRFWYDWPSWPTELLSGQGCVFVGSVITLALRLFVHHFSVLGALIAITCIAVTLAVCYERFWDRNGFSWKDLGQRGVGILTALLQLAPAMALLR